MLKTGMENAYLQTSRPLPCLFLPILILHTWSFWPRNCLLSRIFRQNIHSEQELLSTLFRFLGHNTGPADWRLASRLLLSMISHTGGSVQKCWLECLVFLHCCRFPRHVGNTHQGTRCWMSSFDGDKINAAALGNAGAETDDAHIRQQTMLAWPAQGKRWLPARRTVLHPPANWSYHKWLSP